MTQIDEQSVKAFVLSEIHRFQREKNKKTRQTNSIEVVGVDFHGNFTSVVVQRGKRQATGYAKRNPNLDEYKPEIGLSVATYCALRRLLK